VIKVCSVFNKSNDVSRFDNVEKFLERINSKISLTCSDSAQRNWNWLHPVLRDISRIGITNYKVLHCNRHRKLVWLPLRAQALDYFVDLGRCGWHNTAISTTTMRIYSIFTFKQQSCTTMMCKTRAFYSQQWRS